jgi:hypothetical protein
VPVVLVALVAILWIVPESKDPSPQGLDPLGVVLSIVGLVLLVYGIIKGGETTQWGSAVVLGPLLGGLAVLAVFVRLQRRTPSPMLDVTLFRNPAFSAACGAVTLVMFALFGAVFFMSFYLQYARDYSPLEAGVRLLPVAVALSFFAPRSARLVRRFGTKAVCAGGMLLMTAAFSGYRLIGADTPSGSSRCCCSCRPRAWAHVVAPATESIMSTLPRSGPARLGGEHHRAPGGRRPRRRGARLPPVGGLPGRDHAVARGAAGAGARARGESIGSTQIAPRRCRPAARAQLEARGRGGLRRRHARRRVGSAIVAFLGALVVLRWLPGRAARRPAASPSWSWRHDRPPVDAPARRPARATPKLDRAILDAPSQLLADGGYDG